MRQAAQRSPQGCRSCNWLHVPTSGPRQFITIVGILATVCHVRRWLRAGLSASKIEPYFGLLIQSPAEPETLFGPIRRRSRHRELFSPLQVRRSQDVLILEIHNPGKRNAIAPGLHDALRAELSRAASDAGIGALVLTGADGYFCAGGNLHDIDKRRVLNADERRERLGHLHDVVRRMRSFPKPIIAAVEGGPPAPASRWHSPATWSSRPPAQLSRSRTSRWDSPPMAASPACWRKGCRGSCSCTCRSREGHHCRGTAALWRRQ